VKRVVVGLLAVLVAVSASAVTLVLKGGKRLEVAGYAKKGNAVVVQHPDGRFESYPLVAVDQAATDAANAVVTPPAVGPAAPEGPHSPFFGAQAGGGKAAAVLTDADVQHIAPAGEEGLTPEESAAGQGQVVLLGYEKREAEPGLWEVTATVANQGTGTATNVTANISFIDAAGVAVARGSGKLEGVLEASQTGAITARIAANAEPAKVVFGMQWQGVQTASPGGAPAPPQGPPAQPHAAPPPASLGERGFYSVPADSSPMTVPTNPMGVTNLTAPPLVPQAPPPTAPPAEEGAAETGGQG